MGLGRCLVLNLVLMSSTNKLQTTDLQAKYELVNEVNGAYTNLGAEIQEAINCRKFTSEKTPGEWRGAIEQILSFKSFARQIQGNDFLSKPDSGRDILANNFAGITIIITIIWLIIEHGIYALSWDFWAYALTVGGISGAYTGLIAVLKRDELAEADTKFAVYKKHEPFLKVAHRAEASIEPIYNDFLHPVLAFLYEEIPPQNTLNLHFDICHWNQSHYETIADDPGASRYVTSTEFYSVPVFDVTGKLADGATMRLSATKLVRIRNIRKKNPRGKIKYKTKTKYKLMYQVQMGFPADAYTLNNKRRNLAANIKVKEASNGRRYTIKLQQTEASINNILPKHNIFIELMSIAYDKITPKT